MNLLHTLGLMTRKEHEAWLDTAGKSLVNSERDLKKAEDTARRMGNDRNRIAAAHDILERERDALQRAVNKLNDEIASLRPDALAMRRKRQMDRDRAAGKRGKA